MYIQVRVKWLIAALVFVFLFALTHMPVNEENVVQAAVSNSAIEDVGPVGRYELYRYESDRTGYWERCFIVVPQVAADVSATISCNK